MVFCPNCRSPIVLRAAFRWADLWKALRLLRAMRCRDCGKRFYHPWHSGGRLAATSANKG